MYPMIPYCTTWIVLLLAARWMAPGTFVWVLGSGVIVLLFGLFPSTMERLTGRLMQPFLLFGSLRDLLVDWMNRFQSAVSDLRGERGLTQESVLHSRVAGFLLIMGLSLIVFLAETYLIVGIVRDFIPHGPSADIPVLSMLENYMDWIVGVTVGSGALLWGIYQSDAKRYSNLTSIYDLPAEQRKWVQIKASLLLALFLSLLIGFAIYRGMSLLPDEGIGVEQASAESMTDDPVARLMDSEENTSALPAADSPQSLFLAFLPMGIQVVLAIVTFYTVQLSEWLIGCSMTFAVMAVAKLSQFILWVICLPVCVIHVILSGLASMVLAIFEFITRIAIPIAAPLAAQLGLQHVDDGQAYLASLEARHGNDNDAENAPDQADTERTTEASDLDNPQAPPDVENVSTSDSEKDNDEPLMSVSDNPDEDKPSHNWSPFRK